MIREVDKSCVGVVWDNDQLRKNGVPLDLVQKLHVAPPCEENEEAPVKKKSMLEDRIIAVEGALHDQLVLHPAWYLAQIPQWDPRKWV